MQALQALSDVWPIAVGVLVFVSGASAWAAKIYFMLSQMQKDLCSFRRHRHAEDGSVVFVTDR